MKTTIELNPLHITLTNIKLTPVQVSRFDLEDGHHFSVVGIRFGQTLPNLFKQLVGRHGFGIGATEMN